MDFDGVFAFKPDHAYDSKTYESIISHRRNLDNELFFDRLLKVLQIHKVGHLYPPKSNNDLRTLHHKIVSNNAAEHHRQSLLYYILLDCKASRHAADAFARKCFLPDKYTTYIRGLWHMDRLQFQTALDFLTQPSLIPTFPDEIILTLVRHAPKNDMSLPLAYYHAVSPTLSSPKALDALYTALSRASITEAFYFARGHDEQTHCRLLEHLIHESLTFLRGEERANRAVELINQPFTEEEEGWFIEYLTSGKGKTLHGANDTVMMRRIATGNFAAIVEESKGPTGRKMDGLNWEIIKEGLVHGGAKR
ncbi:MAG: hypothetical protein M4579_003611 [Chaenotheca gracillima]|nr:MAG: hypothetical protein M4579_003611 [Chaenotheca gracillima]